MSDGNRAVSIASLFEALGQLEQSPKNVGGQQAGYGIEKERAGPLLFLNQTPLVARSLFRSSPQTESLGQAIPWFGLVYYVVQGGAIFQSANKTFVCDRSNESY